MSEISTNQPHYCGLGESDVEPSSSLLGRPPRTARPAAIGVTDLSAIVSLLPAPLGNRRANSRLVFPVASAALIALALFALLSSPLAHPRRASAERERDYEIARSQSFGFFDDVSSATWERMRDRSRSSSPHNDEKLGLRSEFANRDDPARWYRDNWDPDFTCPGERRVGGGGDSGKWVCDPHRIRSRADRRNKDGGGGCLVYSIGLPPEAMERTGGDFNLAFERSLMDELNGGCEVHVFDHRLSTSENYQGIHESGIILHPWSVEGELDRGKGRRTHLTFAETVRKLGHGGMTLDVLKVDCEGCEWTQYQDWFDESSSKSSSVAAIDQLLIELHGAPNSDNAFFEWIRSKGYVIFHKELDAQYGGMSVEYGFFRLRKDFFED
uniref:Methyltransferase domain-containing protein n=1 Tax=Odontella aurita TaxID=265563 RepID=A0A7S4M9I2_9STRA|mmetsp:Transcript_14955/g.43552  ORF Transcript_14955/g.43552 Transcript_14955/m.43552 type:complete len:383 (+) Transcript_14955:145-1293(+)